MKNVKELKATAKELNIKGYSKMNRQLLETAIRMAMVDKEMQQQPPIDPSTLSVDATMASAADDFFTAMGTICIRCNVYEVDVVNNPHSSFCNDCKYELDMSINNDNDLVPAAVVEQSKRIAFIKADNTQLYFRADGQVVKVYWSTEDFRLHLQSERRGDRITKYAQLVGMFAKLKNNVDGDVARVMKAIVRLKNMPAAIQAARMKHLVDSGKVHRNQSMEKASSANSKRGCVDPQWMTRYVAWCEDTIGRKPTGLEIRSAWLEEQQA